MNLANEGLEARKKEEEVTAKKRKAEEDAKWEGARRLRLISPSVECVPTGTHETPFPTENRDQRVESWRSFANSGKKKKKAKITVLG